MQIHKELMKLYLDLEYLYGVQDYMKKGMTHDPINTFVLDSSEIQSRISFVKNKIEKIVVKEREELNGKH